MVYALVQGVLVNIIVTKTSLVMYWVCTTALTHGLVRGQLQGTVDVNLPHLLLLTLAGRPTTGRLYVGVGVGVWTFVCACTWKHREMSVRVCVCVHVHVSIGSVCVCVCVHIYT